MVKTHLTQRTLKCSVNPRLPVCRCQCIDSKQFYKPGFSRIRSLKIIHLCSKVLGQIFTFCTVSLFHFLQWSYDDLYQWRKQNDLSQHISISSQNCSPAFYDFIVFCCLNMLQFNFQIPLPLKASKALFLKICAWQLTIFRKEL